MDIWCHCVAIVLYDRVWILVWLNLVVQGLVWVERNGCIRAGERGKGGTPREELVSWG